MDIDTTGYRPPSDGFVWGCATSSYQIEGAVAEDGRGPSIWDAFCEQGGHVFRDQNGAYACDSYHRWPDDVALLAELGVDAYRFSVAWPRIQPDGSGAPLRAGLDYYARLVDALLEAGIEPWITLYHWDLPLSLGKAGGWTERETAYRFADFASILFHELGDRARHWITLNEPWCSAFLGYGTGEHAPGLRDRRSALTATHNLLLAHGLGVQAFRSDCPRGEIGIALNPSTPRPATRREADRAAALRAAVERTNLWLDPIFGRGYPSEYLSARKMTMPARDGDMDIIAGAVDFLGVNYYNEDAVAAADFSDDCPDGYQFVKTARERTTMGWDVVPHGLKRTLAYIARGWPIKAVYITENGAAYADEPDGDGGVHDLKRIDYLRRHIAACCEAIAEGIPLRGYFLWTLMDNFEWSHGYEKRFGLVAVDPKTMNRHPKDSFYFYRDIIAGYLE